jgi:hypothetical protein
MVVGGGAVVAVDVGAVVVLLGFAELRLDVGAAACADVLSVAVAPALHDTV